METTIGNHNKYNGKTTAGLIILAIGGLLLIDQLSWFFIPGWLFTWPMWIIAYGLYVGGKYNFTKPVSIWIIAIGVALLLTENINNADRVVWPVAIISAGAFMVMKHSKPSPATYNQADFKKV
jgi:hypothetical protein